MNGETTLVAISDAPFGSLSMQRLRDQREQLVGVHRAGHEDHEYAEHRLQEPVAQLEQVRHQRTFGQVFRLLFVAIAHAQGTRRDSSSRGVVRSSSVCASAWCGRLRSAGSAGWVLRRALRRMHVVIRRIEFFFRLRLGSAPAGRGHHRGGTALPALAAQPALDRARCRCRDRCSPWFRGCELLPRAGRGTGAPWRARARPSGPPAGRAWAAAPGPARRSASAKISSSSVNPTSNMGMLRRAAVGQDRRANASARGSKPCARSFPRSGISRVRKIQHRP